MIQGMEGRRVVVKMHIDGKRRSWMGGGGRCENWMQGEGKIKSRGRSRTRKRR
jgi:hypothetical protein